MSCTPLIVAGDDVSLAVTLKKSGEVFDIPVASTVTAAVVAMDKSSQYISDTVVSSGTGGADWANSLLIIDSS